MINQRDLNEMRKETLNYDSMRERLIKKSRDVLKLSKQIIYAIHRDDFKTAQQLTKTINIEKKNLDKIAKSNAFLITEGSYKVALQEYAEALLYFSIIKDKKLVTRKELAIPTPYYILGICDLPGELVRKAVHLAGKGSFKEVIAIKDLVDKLYGELLKFDFRDNETRRKFDSIKYDLKKA